MGDGEYLLTFRASVYPNSTGQPGVDTVLQQLKNKHDASLWEVEVEKQQIH